MTTNFPMKMMTLNPNSMYQRNAIQRAAASSLFLAVCVWNSTRIPPYGNDHWLPRVCPARPLQNDRDAECYSIATNRIDPNQNEWSDPIPNDENALINSSLFDIDGSLGMVVRGAPFISNASISISQEPQNMPLQESIGFSMSVFDETNRPINPRLVRVSIAHGLQLSLVNCFHGGKQFKILSSTTIIKAETTH